MFSAEIYQQRRQRLMAHSAASLLLFVGHVDVPMNFAHNCYPFVQDSTFLYLFGLNDPGLAVLMDTRTQAVTLFGNDLIIDDVVWSGVLPSVAERASRVGIQQSQPYAALAKQLSDAREQGIAIDYLPAYRAESVLALARLLACSPADVNAGASPALIKRIIDMREIKGEEEIVEMERALEVTRLMHLAAMRAAQPGVAERQVVGEMEGMVRAHDWQLAYPIIFSRRGEILHTHAHDQVVEQGDLVVNDSGARSASGYASDITRTLPIGGRFTDRQRPLYETVLAMQLDAIAAIAPGVTYLDVHKLAAKTMAERMIAMGFFTGSAQQVVESGAYALAFPHGLGHQIGMDVHDMENLGEDLVGYDEQTKRSALFGLGYLRLGKALRAGMVLTVEPGIYFIPALIDLWRQEGRFTDLINHEKFDEYRQFGGIRIEDNVLVTTGGCRVLGCPIPKTVAEVEACMAD